MSHHPYDVVHLNTPSVHGKFYDEQFKKALKEEQAKKPVTASDVKAAREKMFDAREQLARVQAGETSVYSLQELREKAADAEKHYQEVYQRGGYLEHIEHARKSEAEHKARFEKEQQELQAVFAKEQEAQWAEEASKRFIEAGGTLHQFEQLREQLWQQELVQRMQSGNYTYEARMRASGQYPRI
jgi:hypothetical protein